MKKWTAGEIITDNKWASLNTIKYPIAQKIEFYNNSTTILDISYDELINLLQHNVICWYYDSYHHINSIYIDSIDSLDGRAVLQVML